jgi:hypothetical protein
MKGKEECRDFSLQLWPVEKWEWGNVCFTWENNIEGPYLWHKWSNGGKSDQITLLYQQIMDRWDNTWAENINLHAKGKGESRVSVHSFGQLKSEE